MMAGTHQLTKFEPIKVGVVGLGFGQQVHLPALRREGRFSVQAVCATRRQKAAKVATKYEMPRASDDWRELVRDPAIQALTIAVPPAQQPEIALAAISAGKSVFCEKPLGISSGAAGEMLAASHKTGVAHMVNFGFTEIEAWQRAKALLADGAIGGLKHMVLNWLVETRATRLGIDSWKTSLQQGGGALFGFASHALYNLEWFGGPIVTLWARLHPPLSATCRGDTLVNLSVTFASGAAASVTISTNAFLGRGHCWEFYGDCGSLFLRNRSVDYIRGFELWLGRRGSGQKENVPCGDIEDLPEDGRVIVATSLFRRWADWIALGTPSKPNFEQGLRVQILLEAALTSNRVGRLVTIA